MDIETRLFNMDQPAYSLLACQDQAEAGTPHQSLCEQQLLLKGKPFGFAFKSLREFRI